MRSAHVHSTASGRPACPLQAGLPNRSAAGVLQFRPDVEVRFDRRHVRKKSRLPLQSRFARGTATSIDPAGVG